MGNIPRGGMTYPNRLCLRERCGLYTSFSDTHLLSYADSIRVVDIGKGG
jgi:hypothetical protein